MDASESDPVTIHVAAGTYSASTNGETFPLNMKSWVSLSGEDRDSTILNAENEAYHVICCENVMQLTIEGLTIAGGRADTKWPPDADCLGGGIYCSNCQGGDSLAIQNNRISGNSADSGGGICCRFSLPLIWNNIIEGNLADSSITAAGAGIFCTEYSSPTITDNKISDNSANFGGGISCLKGSSPTIEDNIIIGNSADFSGGAINCYDSPMILDNLISGNSAGAGGGIYCNGSATIQNNSISENTTTGHGGGIHCDWSDKSTIIDNMITSNSAVWFGHGGGIYCTEYSSSMIFGNAIIMNSASHKGGGVHCSQNSWPDILNNVIASNLAEDGGGIYCYGCPQVIGFNTITGNTASSDGGGIYCDSSVLPTIIDCIIWGNGDDLYHCSATYCCIEDNDAGEGNIHEDPIFVPGPFGDYYLDPSSLCINAGSRMTVDADLSDRTTQADGTPDTGTVDMGFHYPIP